MRHPKWTSYRLPRSFYRPPFVGGDRSHVVIVYGDDATVTVVSPALAPGLLQGKVPLPGALDGQCWARLGIAELHLSDHKGFSQPQEDLEDLAHECTVFLRVPLKVGALLDSERIGAGFGRRVHSERLSLEWEPSPKDEAYVLAAATAIVTALSVDFFVRSGRRIGGCIPLDA